MRALALALALLSLGACKHADTIVLSSGEAVNAAGERFIQTADFMRQARDAGAVSPEAYGKWAVFAQRFKVTYPLLVDAWQITATANDAVAAGKIFDALGVLAQELAEFYFDAVAAVATFTGKDGGP